MKTQEDNFQKSLLEFDWSQVEAGDRRKFFEKFEEFNHLTHSNSILNAEYKTRISVLFISMIMTIVMYHLKYSNNAIIIAMFLFQIIITAIIGFLNWGNRVLVNNSKENLRKMIEQYTEKHPTLEFNIKKDETET